MYTHIHSYKIYTLDISVYETLDFFICSFYFFLYFLMPAALIGAEAGRMRAFASAVTMLSMRASPAHTVQ
jgi:hypothetical protein